MTVAEREAYRQRLEVFLASRDAGRDATLGAFRRGVTLDAMIAAAEGVAAYANDALAIVTEEYRPPLACREGCSYCCRKPGVLATVPEFLRLVQHVREDFDADATVALAARTRRYMAQLGGRHFDTPVNESVPCPLLVDERCSVYELRPLVCRGYNSTDVDACRAAHDDTASQVPIFAILKDVTDGASVGVAHALREMDAPSAMVDLGTALGIVFGSGDDFSRTVLENVDQLRAAENASWVDDLWGLVSATARELMSR